MRVDTAAAVGKYIWCSCGSKHCCGSGEVLMELLREQALLRQWGKTGSTPAGADTAAAVGKIQVALMGEQSLLR